MIHQVEFHGRGSFAELLTHVAPYLGFWGGAVAVLAWRYRLKVSLSLRAFRWPAVAPYLAIALCYAALNWPLIGTVACLMASDAGGPAHAWRGGGNPMDLVNPWAPMGLVFICMTLSWRWEDKEGIRPWVAASAFFFVLMLGPWLKVMGFHTYLPLPFWFLHLLPGYSGFPNGTYFATPISLCLAVVLAKVLPSAKANLGTPRLALALLALFLGCWHGSIPEYSLKQSPVLERLASRPYGTVLPVPASAMFHLTVPYGFVGQEFFVNMAGQIAADKPIVGGTLGRSTRQTYDFYMGNPCFTALASGGGCKLRSEFLRDWNIRYLLRSKELFPVGSYFEKNWGVRELDRDDSMVLYEVTHE